jgi:hypothetical protein
MAGIDEEAFWSKVEIQDNKKDCWPWTGAKKPKGYGNLRIDKRYLIAHRVAFEIVNGPIPEGYLVCHICDNPPCCNPGHLMLGTAKSNAADMLIKNRQKTALYASRGERNGNSKLKPVDILRIRYLFAVCGLKYRIIAERFKVSTTTIGHIIRKQTWSHVK